MTPLSPEDEYVMRTLARSGDFVVLRRQEYVNLCAEITTSESRLQAAEAERDALIADRLSVNEVVRLKMAAEAEAEQLRVQLAGCGVAAIGCTSEPAIKGQYGWSNAYQDVLDLRILYDSLNVELDRTRQELAEAHEQLERRIRKPCYANREGVKCAAEVFYLCFHCKQWFCDTHGLFHFGMEPEHGDKRPTTCLLEKVEALRLQLVQKDKAMEKAKALLDKLDLVHGDKRYEGVWTMYHIHGGRYDGPFYKDELQALREALAEIAQIESNSTLGDK